MGYSTSIYSDSRLQNDHGTAPTPWNAVLHQLVELLHVTLLHVEGVAELSDVGMNPAGCPIGPKGNIYRKRDDLP